MEIGCARRITKPGGGRSDASRLYLITQAVNNRTPLARNGLCGDLAHTLPRVTAALTASFARPRPPTQTDRDAGLSAAPAPERTTSAAQDHVQVAAITRRLRLGLSMTGAVFCALTTFGGVRFERWRRDSRYSTVTEFMTADASDSPSAIQLLSALVHNGIGLFAEQLPPVQGTAAQALTQRPIVKTLRDNPRLNWPALCDSVISNILSHNDPLASVIGDFRCSPLELFLLGLVGTAEQSTTLSLAIQELQHPQRHHHPTIQLCLEIGRTLCDQTALTVPRLLQSRLFTSQLLQIEGNEPLAQRRVRIDPFLWSALSGEPALGPGCQTLRPENNHVLSEANLTELPELIEQLLSNPRQLVVIKGLPGSGRHHVASTLANAMGRKAVATDYARWLQNPSIGFTCRFGDAVPTIVLPTTHSGAISLEIPEQLNSPLLVIASLHHTVLSPGAVHFTLSADTTEQRHELWRQLIDNRLIAKKMGSSSVLSNKMIRRVSELANDFARHRGEQIQNQDVLRARLRLIKPYMPPVARHVAPLASADDFVVADDQKTACRFVEELCLRRGNITRGLGSLTGIEDRSGIKVALVGPSGSGKSTFARRLSAQLISPLFAVHNPEAVSSELLTQIFEQAAVHDAILLIRNAPSSLVLQGHESEGLTVWNDWMEHIREYDGICLVSINNSQWQRHDQCRLTLFDMVMSFDIPDVEARDRIWQMHLGSRAPKKSFCRHLAEEYAILPGAIRNTCKLAGGYTDKKRISEQDILQALSLELQRRQPWHPGAAMASESPTSVTEASNAFVQHDSGRH